MVTIVRGELFGVFGFSLGDVLGAAEELGEPVHNEIMVSTISTPYHIISYFYMIFTGGRPCHNLPRRTRRCY